MSESFFKLYQGVDRKGPGEPGDVLWAAKAIGLKRNARICDAGCGSGADVPALLEAAPGGQVTAIDSHPPFIDELRQRFSGDDRVTGIAGDMARLSGAFDLIWSAGAIYFLGVEAALRGWRGALAGGGAAAFSEPCFFVPEPSARARGFWQGYPATDAAGIDAQVRAAGFRTVATRKVSDDAWEAYYRPLQARIDALRPKADADMAQVLHDAQQEIDTWRQVRSQTGYLLGVVRPQ